VSLDCETFSDTVGWAMTRRRTLGDRAFPVAAEQAWNSLPTTLNSQSSLLTFRQRLKTFLFEQSYS